MKLLSLFLIVGFLQVSAMSFSQQVTLSAQNIPLKFVFNEIEKQTGFFFLYDKQLLSSSRPIDVSLSNVPLKEALLVCLKDQKLVFDIKEKTIVISASPMSSLRPSSSGTGDIFSSFPIKVRVVDADGNPLSGASVVNKNTGNSGVTDAGGVLSLNVNVNDVLLISFIGYESYEQKITSSIVGSSDQRSSGTDSFLTVVLKISESKLEEVEVVSAGYYTTTKRMSTGSIVKVDAKEIENQPVTSPLMALQGRVPGLEITPNSGTPGGAPKIRIRGTNSLRDYNNNENGNYPLYIIDGVPVNSSPLTSVSRSFTEFGFDPLSTINPENIESIEILKDGDATAIYGSRGANGVILITTKQIKSASHTNFDVSMYRGVGEVSNKLNLLNTEQYLEMRHEAYKNDGLAVPNIIFAPDLVLWDTTRYTDWQEVLLGGTANITDIQSGVFGGNSHTSFRLGAGYHKETLVFPGDFWYTRATCNFNLNHVSADQKFRATFSFNYGTNKSKLFDDANFVNNALSLPPDAPKLFDEEGNINWEITPSGLDTWTNPMSYIKKGNNATSSNLVINGNFGYEILPNLILKTNLGFTELHGTEITKNPLSSRAPSAITPASRALSTFGNNQRASWIVEPQATYTKNFNDHSINVVAGTTWQESSVLYQRIEASGYTSDAFIESIQAAPAVRYSADEDNRYKYTSLFVRIGYSYMEKYLLNVTGRRDGSSRFGPGNKFGNFGSIGAAWIFSNELFIKDHNIFLSFGKLRASYGITGSDQIGDYKFYNLYRIGLNYNNDITLSPDALFNAKFAWEKTAKLEVAMQLGFAHDRISVEGSWYRNQSSNQLVNYSLPATAGFPSIFKNFEATVENSGWEMVLNTTNITSENLRWTSSFNISFPRNKLARFDGIENSPYAFQYKVGEPLSVRRLYKWTGVAPQTGVHTFLDVNGDGSYDESDKQFMLPANQRYYGGLMNTLHYNNFELSFLFQFSSHDASKFMLDIPGTRTNQSVAVLDRWKQEGDVTDVQRFNQNFSLSQAFTRLTQSDYVIQNASFIRLKTLSLSYLLPKQIIGHLRMQEASAYVQGQNLFTVTKYLNLDPETGSVLPPLRMLTIGVKIKF